VSVLKASNETDKIVNIKHRYHHYRQVDNMNTIVVLMMLSTLILVVLSTVQYLLTLLLSLSISVFKAY
jgi:uncharacterized membrane protein